MNIDKLQQAWQSQRSKPLDINPNHLLKRARPLLFMARLERWATLCEDMLVILFLLFPGTLLWRISGIHKDWPWLIYAACIACFVGFMLFNQWRRRRHAPRHDEPLLAHVERAIKDIELRMWRSRYMLWWETVPIALAFAIPITISLGMKFDKTHDWGILFQLLFGLGFLAVFFTFYHLFKTCVRRRMPLVADLRHRDLEQLRALRETLLNPSYPDESRGEDDLRERDAGKFYDPQKRPGPPPDAFKSDDRGW